MAYAFRSIGSGEWTVEKLTLPQAAYGYRSAITLDAAGDVHIAFLVESLNGNATLGYVSNTSGTWVTESPAGALEIGPYGADYNAPRLSQGSLDIEMKADDQPFITFYDGSADVFTGCAGISSPVYVNYELNLKIAERGTSGLWDIHSLPDIPNKNFPGCLNQGDRFGEFCQILPRDNGQFLVLTNSVHNHELLLFRSGVNDLASWEYQVVDSFRGVLGGTEDFFDTFEAPRAVMSGDSTIYLLTSGSVQYGFSNRTNRNFLTFYQLDQDSVGAETFSIASKEVIPTLIYYRSYLGLASRHPDSIYQVFVDVKEDYLQLRYTFDGGANWEADTLGTFSTSSRMETRIIGDSLYIWGGEETKNAIIEYALPLDISAYTVKNATTSEARGRLVSSYVSRQGGTDIISSVYSEDFRNQILFSTNASGTWEEEVVTSTENLISLAMIQGQSGDPFVAYTGGNPTQIHLITKTNGLWTDQVVSSDSSRNLGMVQSADSTFIVGHDLTTGSLRLYSQAIGSGAWTSEVIDTAGSIPVMLIRNDTLHIAYRNLNTSQIFYLFRYAGVTSARAEVTSPQNYNIPTMDLKLTASGLPMIAFKDGKTDQIFLAEHDGSTWTISEVPTDPGNLIGVPLRLIIDSKDRPWILYNFPDIQDELRLTRRDGSGTWFEVSVLNNQKEIASEFDFLLVEDDFYVIGRKNEPIDQGIGLLYASEGVRTLLEPGQTSSLGYSLVPNPTKGMVEVVFSTEQAGMMEITIYNLQGQMVHHESVFQGGGAQRAQLTLTGLPAGSYLMKVATEKKSGVQKLLLLE